MDLIDALIEDMRGRPAVHVLVGVVSLRERAVTANGVARIKLIGPGWGTSGYYARDLLERDIPKAFPTGTKMHWDHPTRTQERERPEGSLTTLAGETISRPTWQDGPEGPGMYADAKIFGPYQAPVNELAPHIGVSIRAEGRARAGQAEGRRGKVVESIERGHSVDFVTMPGAGGKVVSLFEAARSGRSDEEQINEPRRNDVTRTLDELLSIKESEQCRGIYDGRLSHEIAEAMDREEEANEERTKRMREAISENLVVLGSSKEHAAAAFDHPSIKRGSNDGRSLLGPVA